MSKIVYLDNNATTPLDPRVRDAMLPVLEEHFGNPASSTHSFGWYAEELVKIAREQVASLINAKPEEIVFTSGATESNNLALKGVAYARMKHLGRAQGQIVSCKTEHKSVLDPLAELRLLGFGVDLSDVHPDGLIDMDRFQALLAEDTFLVSVMSANNEIGVIQDIEATSALAKSAQAVFHCDATQAVGRIEVDVKRLPVDLLSFSAHKIYGPKGVGALYVKGENPRLAIEPLIHGGGHEQGLRSGTLNTPAIVGFGAACKIAREEMQSESERIKKLTLKLLEKLCANISGIEVNGSLKSRIPGNLNLAFSGVSAASLIGKINSKLALSASSACTSADAKPSFVLSALGLDESRVRSSIRIGIGRFNTEAQIDFAAEVLTDAVFKLRASR